MIFNSLLASARSLRDSQACTNLINASTILKKQIVQRNLFLRRSKQTHASHPLFTRDRTGSAVPLSWVATTDARPFANLGDALSPIMVSVLSGLPIVHRDFRSRRERLAGVGTIGHNFQGGTVHFWGTGIDGQKNPSSQSLHSYRRPARTQFRVHALRGQYSARIFRQQGIDVPDIYGDPVWFLPAIMSPAAKRYELGVIVHLSELAELTDIAVVKEKLTRYKIPAALATSVRIINTLTQPSFAAIATKVDEITSCKRIVSTSLHGLVIAEAYGIPCAYFRPKGRGLAHPEVTDETERIDHRIRDFYSGVGARNLLLYGQRNLKETNWDAVMNALDIHWQPLEWSPERFLAAFPLPLAFNPLQENFSHQKLDLSQIKL